MREKQSPSIPIQPHFNVPEIEGKGENMTFWKRIKFIYHDRAVHKAITYRILGFTLGSLVLFLYTGTWIYTPAIFIMDGGKVVFYIFHEKLWRWYDGRKKSTDSP